MNKFKQEYFNGTTPSTIPHTVIKSTVDEILSIANKKLKKKTKTLKILDVGSGWGEYSFELEKYAHDVVGIEPYKKLFDTAIKNKATRKSKVKFYNVAAEDFRSDEKFDLILSLTTIEHMSDAKKSFERMFSLLNPGGMIYATTPNKWWVFESHYGLPFLGWLPLSLADRYLRVTGLGTSYKDCSYTKSYFGMKKLFNNFDCTYYFHLPEANSAYLGCGSSGILSPLVRSAGIGLIKTNPFFWSISKGFIVVAVKNNKL